MPSAAFLVLAIGGCAAAIDQSQSFEYTDSIRDTIAMPILKKELGEAIKYYDPEKPDVTIARQKVVLFFDWDFKKGGINVLDPPQVAIVLYLRTLRVCAVHTNPSYVLLSDEDLLRCR